MILDTLTALLVVLGGFFAMIAGLGLLRLPDVFIRMHASTKAGTLGVGLVMLAVSLQARDAGVLLHALLILVFLLLTVPIAAHLLGRAAYRTGTPLWRRSVIDELAPDDADAPPQQRRDGRGDAPDTSATAAETGSEAGRGG